MIQANLQYGGGSLPLNLIDRIMESKDLRIGNLLFAVNTDKWFRLLPEHLGDKDEEVLGESEPIPLTEEWLIKFGFSKHVTEDKYVTYALNMINVNDSIVYVCGLGFLKHILA